MQNRSLVVLLLLLVPGSLFAQYERFELGRRLVELERTWEGHRTPEDKKKVLAPLSNAVNRFFSFQFGTAAQSLDTAGFLLRQEHPSEAHRWCMAIGVNPESRLIEARQKELILELNPFYPVKVVTPPEAHIHLSLERSGDVRMPLTKFPQKVQLPLKPLPAGDSADLVLKWEFELEGKRFGGGSLMISRVDRLGVRLDQLREQFAAAPVQPRTTELASLELLLNLLQSLADRTTLETNYPCARLLDEAESLARTILRGEEFYTLNHPGEFWLAVPTPRYDAVCRVFVPKGLNRSRPIPIVFALHGAGGSENLFFDGYGDGITRKMCAERGWIMVAPRSPGFTGSPAVGLILDELQTRYPIDPKRVFLVGHSMGAAQAIAIAQQIPERLTGVAALGGGGQVKKGASIQKLPFFIGVGSADFALGGSRSLTKALRNEAVKTVDAKEYADVEHMMIVREAMPEVFQRFEDWGK